MFVLKTCFRRVYCILLSDLFQKRNRVWCDDNAKQIENILLLLKSSGISKNFLPLPFCLVVLYATATVIVSYGKVRNNVKLE
jgi:hypothetical protein